MLGSVHCDSCGAHVPAYADAMFIICSCGNRVERPSVGPAIEPIVLAPNLEEAGRACWLALHSYPSQNRDNWSPIAAKQWLEHVWEPTIPSYGCDCVSKYREFKQAIISEAVFETPEAFYWFGVKLHNMVNAELGKAEWFAPSIEHA